MTLLASAIVVGVAAASSSPAASASGLSNVRDCKQDFALLERSLDIARRSVKASDPELATLIASDAKFELRRGDTGVDFRERGVAAARAFFRAIKSNTLVVRKGIAPFCAVGSNTAVVEFISANGNESVVATFTFKGSQLKGVRADTFFREVAKLTEGNP